MGAGTARRNEQRSPQSDVPNCDLLPRPNELLTKLVRREAETFARQKQTLSAAVSFAPLCI